MNSKIYLYIVFSLLLSSLSFAYDVSLSTDKFVYPANDTIFLQGSVESNGTGIENATVALSYSGPASYSGTFITNTTGEFNYTLNLSLSGTYSIVENYSGNVVTHTIKVKPYKYIIVKTDKPTYTSGDNAVLDVIVTDANGASVSGQTVTPVMRYLNKSSYPATISPSSAETDSAGRAAFAFAAPSAEGEYLFEVNDYEGAVKFVIGGFEPSIKINPTVGAKNSNITIRIAAKTPSGQGIAVSGQIVITAPNSSQSTITSLAQFNDTTGTSVTGIYENIFSYTPEEGRYSVKTTITQSGSNLTRELLGSFEIKSYSIEIIPRTAVNFPGGTVMFDIKLRNTSSNDLVSGKLTDLQKDMKVYDFNRAQLSSVAPSLSTNPSDTSRYVVTVAMPSGIKSGAYSLEMRINDSYGSGSGSGYFTVQAAKPEIIVSESFNGTLKKSFLSGKQAVVRASAKNSSGYVNVSSVAGYSVEDESGNDVTSLFQDRSSYTTYTGGTYHGYVNLTTPKNGGRYIIKVKLNTDAGTISAETWIIVKVFDFTVRPVMSGTENTNLMMGYYGAGYMFAFRPNATARFNVTVRSAQEEEGESGFKFGMTGSAMKGTSQFFEGGIGGTAAGSAVSGATIDAYKVININTEEDVTSSVTVTKGVTNTNGVTEISIKSNVNGGNWSGGFYVVFLNASSTANQTDRTEGFFEVRKYFVNVWVQNPACTGGSNFLGGGGYVNCWNIGPNDNVNVTVKVIEPGAWSSIAEHGNATILGMYYTGSMGEFVFPPKKVEGSNSTCRINGNGECSAILNVSRTAEGRWKSGFYEVRVLVNMTNGIDTGNGFMTSRVYEGWAYTVNNATGDYDYTTRTDESPKFAINIYDVQNHGPAANVTVEFRSIMSAAAYPPAEYAYNTTINSTITNANGVAYLTLPAPANSWTSGDYFVIFNARDSIGNNSDTIQGWFQVKEFFASMQPSSWQYRRNSTVTINVTLSTDPVWMMQNMGGYAASSKTVTCFGSNETKLVVSNVTNTSLFDVSGDGVDDINISMIGPPNHNKANISTLHNGYAVTFMGCGDKATQLGMCNNTSGSLYTFDTYKCNAATMNARVEENRTKPTNSLNFSIGMYYCVNTTDGKFYKLYSDGGDSNTTGNTTTSLWKIKAMEEHGQDTTGGCTTTASNTSTAGFSYLSGSLKSLKVCTFEWGAGESCLTEGVHYNVTSFDSQKTGLRNITIPGVGAFKLVPEGAWPGSGDSWLSVRAEFNTTPTNKETAFSGFSISTFYGYCYRQSWGTLQAGSNMTIICDVKDPQTWGAYSTPVEVKITSVTNSQTGAAVSAGLWGTTINYTNASTTTATITFNQSLSTGTYYAIATLNETSASKTSWIWFEVKDFDASFWSDKWSYKSSDNFIFNAEGWTGDWSNRQSVAVNVSGNPTIYKYDKTTWARTQVSLTGISWFTTNSSLYGTSRTTVNVSKTGGWQEGQYAIEWNLKRMSGTTGTVPVSSWFEVKSFEVSGWSDQWSAAPNDNITMNMNVYNPGSWGSAYNASVNVSVSELRCGPWGSNKELLTKGTNYTSVDNVTNPATTGNPIKIRIVPITNLPAGSCQATLSITSGSNTARYDLWFEVVAFYLSTYADRWEYMTNENIGITVTGWKPSGGYVNITNIAINSLIVCSYSNCSVISVSSLNYTYAPGASTNGTTTNKLTINASSLAEGWYNGQVTGTDARGLTATSWIYWKLSDSTFAGSIPYPYNGTNNKWSYFINDTLLLNVTGKVGINVTNATFSTWKCGSSGCNYSEFVVVIGRNLTSTNMIINITPNMTSGLNQTWITDDWGGGWYTVNVYGITPENKAKSYSTYASVYFPTVWNYTNLEASPTQSIRWSVRACLDYDYTCNYPVSGATVNITNVYYDSWYSSTELNSSNWNSTVMTTGSDGSAAITLSPNTTVHNWTNGNTMRIRYKITYYNATTLGEKSNVRIKQNTLGASAALLNLSNNATINATAGNAFWIRVTVTNSNTAGANTTIVSISSPVNKLNTSTTAANLSLLVPIHINVSASSSATANWAFNTSQAGNYSASITVSPTASGFVPASATIDFKVS